MNKGFTIIELIISIFVLSVGVIGVFGAFSVITILTSDTKDRFSATYLAQEGMEVVRNIRDTNWINMENGNPETVWNNSLDNCLSGCEVDYTTTGSIDHSVSPFGSSGRYLTTTGDNSFYGYTVVGKPTKFKRKIIITNPVGYIMKVVIQVCWDKKPTILKSNFQAAFQSGVYSSDNCVAVEETLYDWFNYAY